MAFQTFFTKRFLNLAILLLALLSFAAYSFLRDEQEPDYYNLSPEEVREDFLQLTEKIESEVPNAFYYCYQSDYNLVKNSILSQLQTNMTSQEVYQLFYPLIQTLNDAHFSIHLPDAIIEKEVNTYFPLRVIINGQRIYCLQDLSDVNQIKKGEEILAINQVPTKDIIKKLKGIPLKHINDKTFFEYRTQDIFHRRLYPLFGFKDVFEVKTPSNTYSLKGVPLERIDIKAASNYEFKVLENEIGYLKINSLVWENNSLRDSLKHFLEKNFSVVKKDSIDKLIVDIRGNLGGSSVLAKDILDCFAHTPYTLAVGVDYFSKGKMYSSDLKELHKPSDSQYKFKGKVVLLSDVLTYSSAQMMQVGFKHYNMGTTVGHQSSESHYITGEVKKTVLKNSGIELYAPTANFRLPGYSETEIEYYTPDHVVYPTLSDKLNGNDVLLNKAIDVLKSL